MAAAESWPPRRTERWRGRLTMRDIWCFDEQWREYKDVDLAQLEEWWALSAREPSA